MFEISLQVPDFSILCSLMLYAVTTLAIILMFMCLACELEDLYSTGTETTEEYNDDVYNPQTEWETHYGEKYGAGSELPAPLGKKGIAACNLTLEEYEKFGSCCPKGNCYDTITYDDVMHCRRTYWGMPHEKRWAFMALNVELMCADKVQPGKLELCCGNEFISSYRHHILLRRRTFV